METNRNGRNDQDDFNATGKHHDHRDGSEETNLGINKDASGEDRYEQGKEERRFHEEHGNRKYKMFRNHSSADDQPSTNTGPDL